MKINTHCKHCEKKYELDFTMVGKNAKCRDCGWVFIIIEEEEKISIEVPKVLEKWEDINFKPYFWSFMLLRNPLIIISIIIAVIIFPFFISVGLWILILSALITFWHYIVYTKTFYTITDRKLIYTTGSLISDNTAEIMLNKITAVESVLGFIQYSIFKTGSLFIKTAGAGSSKVTFKNIVCTLDMYEELQIRMRKNGFRLLKDTLVQTAKPHWLWVVGEVAGKIIGGSLIFLYLSLAILGAVEEAWMNWIGGDLSHVWGWIILPVIFFVSFMLYIAYQDLKRRKYEVFTDSIFYTEWFLTKHYSFLPMENVSDTENIQSFWSKVFGLHDVVVSSSGSSNNVCFKNMVSGMKMVENIKYLKDKTIMWVKSSITWEEIETPSPISYKDALEDPLEYDKAFVGEYKMNKLRSFIGIIVGFILFLPFIILSGWAALVIFIPMVVRTAIAIACTSFKIQASSVDFKYDFLSQKHNSFSVEKITKVKIVESLLDKLFQTCTISFSSIGSSSPIKFVNVKKTPTLYKDILAKVGIREEVNFQNIPIRFSLISLYKAHFLFSCFFLLGMILIIIIGSVSQELLSILILIWGIILVFWIIFLCMKFYYSKRFYNINIYSDFIKSAKWIIFQTQTYALFRHIKSVKTIKYMLTKTGSLELNISGEAASIDKRTKRISFSSNTIWVHYLEDIVERWNMLENTINNRVLDITEVASAKPDIANSIYAIVILSILIVGWLLWFFILNDSWDFAQALPGYLIIISIITALSIWIIIWKLKVQKYSLQKERVYYTYGIFYKKSLSITYARFNIVELGRGFANKIFKNAGISIYTLGSSSKELFIKQIPNFSEIYKLIKKD